jgi:hypothetical protein
MGAMNRLFGAAMMAVMATTALPVGAAANDLSSAQVATIVLTEVEKRIIGTYYQHQYAAWVETESSGSSGKGKGKNKHGSLPPGLAKKGTLPPGLAKQLARNGTLPPGLAKRALPHDLLVQLPPPPAGCQLVLVDDKVMLVRAATNLILDVLVVAAAEAS